MNTRIPSLTPFAAYRLRLHRGCVFTLSAVAFLFTASIASSQTDQRPICVHPLVSDTLDRYERETFHLLPQIAGFRSALFYLNPDSTLRVLVTAVRDGGETIIELPSYRDIRSIHFQIEQVKRITLGYIDTQGSISSTQKTKLFPPPERILLEDSTVIIGSLVPLTDDSVRIQTATGEGERTVTRSQISRINRLNGVESGSRRWLSADHSVSHLFLMPTAETLPAGKFHLGTYLLFHLSATLALTDNTSINGMIYPNIDNDYLKFKFFYGFKVGLGEIAPLLSLGFGAQFLAATGEGNCGYGYTVMSLGDDDVKMNLTLGFGFTTAEGKTGPLIFGLGGDARLTERVKLLAEVWPLPEVEYSKQEGAWLLGIRIIVAEGGTIDLGWVMPINRSFWHNHNGYPVISLFATY